MHTLCTYLTREVTYILAQLFTAKPSAYDSKEAVFVDNGKVIRVKSIDVDIDNGDCRCIGYKLDK